MTLVPTDAALAPASEPSPPCRACLRPWRKTSPRHQWRDRQGRCTTL